MRRRQFLSVAGLATLTAPAWSKGKPRYELVHPRVCLAGHWGKPQREWRVQLGVFDGDGATRLQKELRRKGVKSQQYIAMWRATGDSEPLAVVSAAVFANGPTAVSYAQALNKRGIAGFAREYVRYVP